METGPNRSMTSLTLLPLQCGHAGTRVETSPRSKRLLPVASRFNAATREPAWRPLKVRGFERTVFELQCGHAGTRVETQERQGKYPTKFELQCGHAGTRVETCWLLKVCPGQFSASMRPRGNPRGDLVRYSSSDSADQQLQCGHAGTRVETGQGFGCLARSVQASMRPRGNPRGDRTRTAFPALNRRRFNAATREPAWRPTFLSQGIAIPAELQCGHAGTRVETRTRK